MDGGLLQLVHDCTCSVTNQLPGMGASQSPEQDGETTSRCHSVRLVVGNHAWRDQHIDRPTSVRVKKGLRSDYIRDVRLDWRLPNQAVVAEDRLQRKKVISGGVSQGSVTVGTVHNAATRMI